MSVFQIDEHILSRYNTLDPDDLGMWTFVCQGALMGPYDDEEDALLAKRAIDEEPSGFEGSLGFDSELQCHDGDDNDDDQGGVWGDFDNVIGEDWSDDSLPKW